MDIFTGTLSIISHQSSLGTDLLMKAGIADPTQAMFAATQFLVKIKKLQSGQFIQVTGDRVPNVGIIIMQNAQPASPQLLGRAATNLDFDAELAESELMSAFTETERVSDTAKSQSKRKPKSGRKAAKSNSTKTEKTTGKQSSKKNSEK